MDGTVKGCLLFRIRVGIRYGFGFGILPKAGPETGLRELNKCGSMQTDVDGHIVATHHIKKPILLSTFYNFFVSLFHVLPTFLTTQM
jgi:hypothetical protein